MKSTSHTEVVGATPIVLGENREELAQLLKKITSGTLCTTQEKRDFSDLFYCIDELTFSYELEKKLFLLLLNTIANDDEFSCISLDFEWIIDLHAIVFEKGNRKLFDTFYMKPIKVYLKPKKQYKKQIIWDFIESNLTTRFIFDCNQLRKKRNIAVLDPSGLVAWNLFSFWLYKKENDIYHEKTRRRKSYKKIKYISFEQAALYLPVFLLRQFDNCCEGPQNIQYFKYLIEGNNIRKASFLPFKMTRKMSFHFHALLINTTTYNSITSDEKESPFKLLNKNASSSWERNFSYPLLYAFVMGLGGNTNLVRQFSGIYSKIDDYDFQKSIVEFFIRYKVNNDSALRRLLGYISHMRQEFGKIYSLKGRTIASITRSTNEYYEDQQRVNDREFLLKSGMLHAKWRGANYKTYHKKDETGEYQIVQLLESLELVQESRMMSHCVRTYIGKCITGRCSIWSLRKNLLRDDSDEWKSLVTIEINKHNHITQAKSNYNYKPSKECMDIIKEWAITEGIEIVL
ncbi:MAG: hypothetical protein ACI94Y_001867 [Maribacter sp.]|jgi:hypothetical protein